MSNNNLWLQLDHFERWEWKYDPDKASPELVLIMDRLREYAGVPVHIHVCWAQDGHAPQSYHYTGQAVDFRFGDGLRPMEEFAAICAMPELMGIGYYPLWGPRPGWHVDIRREPARLYWYHDGNTYLYGFKNIILALGGRHG